VIEIDVRRICLVMLLASIPLLAFGAGLRSPDVIYAIVATTVVQMVAIALVGVVIAARKRLTARTYLEPSR
jgi:hypothetical protein